MDSCIDKVENALLEILRRLPDGMPLGASPENMPLQDWGLMPQ